MLILTALSIASLSVASASLNVERWSPPLPSCTPYTPFVYVGCFQDPSIPSALIYRATTLSNTNMTVEICVDFCKGNGYRYAGLEYYGECFCGASVNGPQIAESNCVDPCTGNQTEACGGTDIISVYMDPTFPTVDDTTIADYQSLGCYTEGTNGRALVWQQTQLSTSNLTVEECLFACKDGGYNYAGVEFATQCFCGVVLGNGSVPTTSSTCDMACTGNASETCGGPGALNLYVATDLESTQPCDYVPPPPSSSSTSSTTSATSSSSSTTTSTTPTTSSSTTTSTSPTTSTSSKSSTSSITSTSTKTTSSTKPSLCTSTTVTSPTPTCEYKCGNWCSNPLPPFSDQKSCLTAASNCAVQLFSCFLNAGFPDSLHCVDYSGWCDQVSSYCYDYCPGNSCSVSECKSKYPPSGPPCPSPTTSTSVYTCSSTPVPTVTTCETFTTSVPVPTATCVCKQPNSPSKGYSSSSPVGSIPIPCLNCNNLYSDYEAGNWFKLYTSSESSSCPSYPQPGVPQGCKDACDTQYSACLGTYAESCKSNTWFQILQGADSYESACDKCQNQWNDCHSCNAEVSGHDLCTTWNFGWH